MYRPRFSVCQVIDDNYYQYDGCTFQKVESYEKGHFTIHPQFVSENIVELRKQKKQHQK